MKKIRPFLPLITLYLAILLVACSPAPEVMIVEITRLVPQIEQVEVTRLVEIEKEVTRIVEIPGDTAVPVTDLDRLQIEFWPDYDQPAVLVLLTGRVPAGLPLPAEIAIPIPQDAQINAVAQINDSGMASIDYTAVDGAVLFRSATPAFRIEYYVPYWQDQNLRAYDFQWIAPFSVAELGVQIQRPANAIDLATQPAASAVITDPADGLDYYNLDPLAVSRGIPYRLSFNYTMISDSLTVEELSPTPPDLPDNPLHDQQACIQPCALAN